MAGRMPVDMIYERIGHDGSEIIWPHLPEPRCRRAFHIQECINAVWPEFAVTPLELCGHLSPDGVSIFEINFRYPELGSWSGVVLGRGGHGFRIRHAVAFCANRIYDPNGLIYDFEINGNSHFSPEVIYRFDLIL
jgi:hypothetical protein